MSLFKFASTIWLIPFNSLFAIEPLSTSEIQTHREIIRLRLKSTICNNFEAYSTPDKCLAKQYKKMKQGLRTWIKSIEEKKGTDHLSSLDYLTRTNFDHILVLTALFEENKTLKRVAKIREDICQRVTRKWFLKSLGTTNENEAKFFQDLKRCKDFAYIYNHPEEIKTLATKTIKNLRNLYRLTTSTKDCDALRLGESSNVVDMNKIKPIKIQDRLEPVAPKNIAEKCFNQIGFEPQQRIQHKKKRFAH